MSLRCCVAPVAALFVILSSAAVAEPPKPQITGQSQPLGKTLADVKTTMIQLVPKEALPEVSKQFDEGLKEMLGEKGFTGIDMTRPIYFYAYTDEESPEMLEAALVYLAVPFTTQPEFLDLLKRVEIEAAEKKGEAGVYSLTTENEELVELFETPVQMKFKDGYAFMISNAKPKNLADEWLLPVDQVVQPGETATVALRGHPSRYPEKLRDEMISQIDKAIKKAQEDGDDVPEELQETMAAIFGNIAGLGKSYVKEVDTATVRLVLDPETAQFAYDLSFRGRDGSELAKTIASRKPTTNKFGGLLTPQTLVGFRTRLPFFTESIRSSSVEGLKYAEKASKDEAPEEFHPIIEEVYKGLARTVKGGEFDMAMAMVGPNKDGHYSVSFGIAYEDTSGLDKALRQLYKDAPEEIRLVRKSAIRRWFRTRQLYKDAPEEIQNQIKLDDAKAGDVSIHRAPVGFFLPEEVKMAFGERVSVCFALAPNGIYVTFGTDAVELIKANLASPKVESPVLDIVINSARYRELVATMGGEEVADMLFDKDAVKDEQISMFQLDIRGGEELTIRLGTNLKVFAMGGMFLGLRGAEAFIAP